MDSTDITLNLKDNIFVEIEDWGYIDEIDIYGPTRGFIVCSVKNVIEMFNNNRRIKLRDEFLNEPLFFLIKKYNGVVESGKNKKYFKKADVAEQRLFNNLYQHAIIEEIEDQKDNPLENPETEIDVMSKERELEMVYRAELDKRDKEVKSSYTKDEKINLKRIRKSDLFKNMKLPDISTTKDYDLDLD